MVAVAVLLMVVAAVPLWIGLPVWNPLLESAVGWLRPWPISKTEALLLLILLTLLVGVPLALVEGMLVDNLGSRRMVFIGLTMLGFGLALGSLAPEGWLLYVAFTLVVLGGAIGAWLPMMKMLNNWFDRRKTMAMGVALGGFGLARIVLPLLLIFGLAQTDLYATVYQGPAEFKWGAVTLAVGLVYLALAFPLSRLVRDRPEDLGLLPDGDAPPPNVLVQQVSGGSPATAADWGYDWWQAVRSKNFWLMTIGNAAALLTLGTLPVYLWIFLEVRDDSLVRAGTVIGLSTLVSALFMFVTGYLGDRFSMRKLAFAFSAVLALSVVLLVAASGTGLVYGFAMLFGMAMGGESVVMVAMRGRYFGRKAFATITNLSLAPPQLLVVMAPLVFWAVWDWRWDYDAAFLGLAAITLVGGLAFLFMGEPPNQRPRLLVDDIPLEQATAEQPSP